MRIVFMGTPEFAAGILAALYQAGYELPLVVTQPDRLSGRGKKQWDSPAKAFAVSHGLPVYQPGNLKENEAIQRIQYVKPDAIVVAAYGKLLPARLLDIAPLGCLNVHASLLPAYRGAAPMQWALLNGEKETGVTIMKLDEGMDTGPLLSSEKIPITDTMDFGSLYQALTELGAKLLLETLPLWAAGNLVHHPQPDEGVSYAPRLERKDEIIDWSAPADEIGRRIRAFSPSPGASTRFQTSEVKIVNASIATGEDENAVARQDYAEIVSGNSRGGALSDGMDGQYENPGYGATMPADIAHPGQIIGIARHRGPIVATGNGYLLLTHIQPAGKKPMDGWAWLNGSRARQGQSFCSAGETDNGR